jgi:DNA-binding transcriptional ArsR family regulator
MHLEIAKIVLASHTTPLRLGQYVLHHRGAEKVSPERAAGFDLFEFSALTDNPRNGTRLAAIEQLMEKPMSVNELAAALGQEQSMVSHNLKPLLQCNLINIQKQGKKHIYTANQDTLNPIFEAIQNHAQKFCPTGGKCLREENQ